MTTRYINIGGDVRNSASLLVPAERTFREAWAFTDTNSGVIDVDMGKARNIYRNKLREARKEALAKLDAQFMQALEKGKPSDHIAARKQELRDVTLDPAIEAATTPQELRVLKLAGLEV